MIASALNSDCRYLITEDMADVQIIDNKLTIINIYSKNSISRKCVALGIPHNQGTL
jgi:hypothetical protein